MPFNRLLSAICENKDGSAGADETVRNTHKLRPTDGVVVDIVQGVALAMGLTNMRTRLYAPRQCGTSARRVWAHRLVTEVLEC